jgi:RNase P subunit RPR2
MADAQAYCVKCREMRNIQDPQEVTMKNGRPAIRGKCGTCGTTIQRIVSMKKSDGDGK